ncbi:MAG: hypothetical protein IPO85_18180 [Saprospiraceae bacterium]|uniref:Uncharacterized protein n=1 Tax=Candidatus Defluviibacterium haderslevense TaxID=2981993 RepID=A0A9D7SCD8_9BACT|nr:hypothetical protein [Candidatus Defluviibacterium haderslevense]
MKSQLIFLNLLFTIVLSAQKTDSIVIKQVDSLIKVSRSFTTSEDFEKALSINAMAEKIALEKLGSGSQ